MTTPPWEPSAWLRDAISHRMRNMAEALAMADEKTVVVISLTDRPDGKEAAEIWEFTCDRCGKYCATTPDSKPFITGSVLMVMPGVLQVNVTLGMCSECAEIEQVPQF